MLDVRACLQGRRHTRDVTHAIVARLRLVEQGAIAAAGQRRCGQALIEIVAVDAITQAHAGDVRGCSKRSLSRVLLYSCSRSFLYHYHTFFLVK